MNCFQTVPPTVQRRRLAAVLLVFACASVCRAQQPSRSPGVSLVAVGEIVSINARKKTFEVRSDSGSEAEFPEPRRDGIHGSIWIGGGRTRSNPDPARNDRSSDWPPQSPMEQMSDGEVRTTITTTSETHFSEREADALGFQQLRVGDTVEVTGIMKGMQIEARRIVRTRAAPPKR